MGQMNENNKLAVRMLLAMVLGIAAGLFFMYVRESLGPASSTWQMINNILFQDITAKDANQAIGIFYIGGQLFIRSLQLIIVPMVFSSIVLAICEIREASTLGRMAGKTIGWFMATSTIALILAGIIGYGFYANGFFNTEISGLSGKSGSAGANPLLVILNIIPANIGAAMSVNNAVLSIVFLAIGTGLAMNTLNLSKESAIYKLCAEMSKVIVVFLNFVVKKFGPVAIFMLLSRTFATYGIGYLKPAFAYVLVCVVLLLFYLFIGYPLILTAVTKLNGFRFIRKIFRVIVFGFSTSSSAATLPLNMDTNVNEMGVDKQISSFVLPLGMTINMDGTAIMQVIATFFIAGAAGFYINLIQIIVIMVLALIASAGTPAAPGAGAIILFTILSGVGITNEAALIAYSLILAINRPIEMLVTALNCVGDSVAAICVAISEGKMDRDVFNR